MCLKITLNGDEYNFQADTSIYQLKAYYKQPLLHETGREGLNKICRVFLNAIANRIIFHFYTQFYDTEYLKEYETIQRFYNARTTFYDALCFIYKDGRPIDVKLSSDSLFNAMKERYKYITASATISYDRSDGIWSMLQEQIGTSSF